MPNLTNNNVVYFIICFFCQNNEFQKIHFLLVLKDHSPNVPLLSLPVKRRYNYYHLQNNLQSTKLLQSTNNFIQNNNYTVQAYCSCTVLITINGFFKENKNKLTKRHFGPNFWAYLIYVNFININILSIILYYIKLNILS